MDPGEYSFNEKSKIFRILIWFWCGAGSLSISDMAIKFYSKIYNLSLIGSRPRLLSRFHVSFSMRT